MRPNEVKECFRKIEQDANVNGISLMGICAWPLIRSVLYSELSKSPNLNDESKLSTLRKLFEQIFYYGINAITTLVRKYIANRNSDLVEILAFGHSAHYTKVNSQKHRSDRIMDPVISLLGMISHKKFVLGSLPLGHYEDRNLSFRPHLGNLSFRTRRHNRDFLLEGLIESGLLSVLEKYGINSESFNKLMSKPRDVFLDSYLGARKILDKNPKVRTIFLSVWYAPIVMGITAAARQLSIRVVDVQHGAEISSHAMYCDWTDVPGEGYLMLPSNFWCWDENFERTINESFSRNINHLAMTNCPTWLNFRMEQLSHTNFFNKIKDENISYKYRLLYTLQPPCFDTTSRIPSFLIEFLEQDNPDVLVSIRRHPNDPGDITELSLFQNRKFSTAYSVISSSEDLVQSLCFSTHHLTRFSTVCYEAENLGVPSLLFGPESYEFYTTEIQSSRFRWTPGNSADLYSFLKETTVGRAKLATMSESLEQIQILIGQLNDTN